MHLGFDPPERHEARESKNTMKNKDILTMALKTVKLSSAHQVYLPEEILEAAHVREGERFVLRVRDGVIELVPERLAEQALEDGLENLKAAGLDQLQESWGNPEDEAWDEA